jgi:AAHS family benzoate transporter-like MFS transporter
VLGGIGVVGLILTMIIPKSKAEAVTLSLPPTITPAAAVSASKPRLYGTIMVVVDHTGNKLTRARVSEFVSLTGMKVNLVYLAPSMCCPPRSTRPTRPLIRSTWRICRSTSMRSMLKVSRQWGGILTATLFDRGKAVINLAERLKCDLIILNTEEGGQRAKAELAQEVARKTRKWRY